MNSTKPVAITSAGQNSEADMFMLSLKLNGSGRTNVLEWLDKLGSVLGAKRGFVASVLFATFKNYSIPAPDLQFSGEGMPEWTEEQLEILQADADMDIFGHEDLAHVDVDIFGVKATYRR